MKLRENFEQNLRDNDLEEKPSLVLEKVWKNPQQWRTVHEWIWGNFHELYLYLAGRIYAYSASANWLLHSNVLRYRAITPQMLETYGKVTLPAEYLNVQLVLVIMSNRLSIGEGNSFWDSLSWYRI